LPGPPHLKPAIGGLGVGLLALVLPQVLAGGYGWIQEAINGQLSLALLFILIFAKIIAFALTVSSGGSGGVFAPSLFVGAMLGGFFARLVHQPSAAFAVIGMAAVFGAAARVPFATLLMVTEMTGGYRLLVPAALAVMLSYLVQVVLSQPFKYRSLYEAQVPAPVDSPAHHAEQLRIAVRLLDEQNVPVGEQVGHLNMIALLKSGIPIELPGEKRLMIGTLRVDSPCVGTTIRSGCLLSGDSDGEIVAIVRQKRLFLPHPNTKLQAGDQLVILAGQLTCEHLAPHWVQLPSAPAAP
jgi:CIC family chloride channel protein